MVILSKHCTSPFKDQYAILSGQQSEIPIQYVSWIKPSEKYIWIITYDHSLADY